MSAPTSAVPAAPEALEQGTSLGHDAWLRLRKNKLAVFGLVCLAVVSVLCLIGPWLLPYGYEEQKLELGASGPSGMHWLGTDTLGRDLLVRLLYGGRISLGVGLAATFVALTIGVVYGAVAGFFGGKLDAVLMRIVDKDPADTTSRLALGQALVDSGRVREARTVLTALHRNPLASREIRMAAMGLLVRVDDLDPPPPPPGPGAQPEGTPTR